MKEYTLDEWHEPPKQGHRLRKSMRKRARGPVYEEMIQRDGAWPEFKPFEPKLPPAPKPKPVLTPEKIAERHALRKKKALDYYYANKDKLAEANRVRARRIYANMSPEQRAIRAERHKAFMRAHPEKRREYNQRYNAKHPERYKKRPREGHGPDGRFLPKHK
jgi:hypothetical protein